MLGYARSRQAIFWVLPALLLVIGAGCVWAQDVCTIGNLNGPDGPQVPDVFQGHETYAYHAFPPDQCNCDEGGFTPETVSQLLYFDSTQFPVTFQVEAQLLAAIYDPGNDCYLPGTVICAGNPVTITVVSLGQIQVTAPFEACAMQPFGEHYFLALKYTGNAPGYLVTDNLPLACTEYVDRGNGWEDMFLFPDKTGGGKSIIFGDIVCGALSVDNEPNSWGAIKSLYR